MLTICSTARIAALAACCAFGVQAKTLIFNLPNSLFVPSPIIQDGLKITNSQTFDAPVAYINEKFGGYAAGIYPTIGVNYAHTDNDIVGVNGQPITITKIGLSDIFNSGVGGTVDYTIVQTDGTTVTGQFLLQSGIIGQLQEFPVSAKAIRSLSFNADSLPWIQFDLSVPEPSAWALMILGFGLVGFALRRRPALGRNAAI